MALYSISLDKYKLKTVMIHYFINIMDNFKKDWEYHVWVRIWNWWKYKNTYFYNSFGKIFDSTTEAKLMYTIDPYISKKKVKNNMYKKNMNTLFIEGLFITALNRKQTKCSLIIE